MDEEFIDIERVRRKDSPKRAGDLKDTAISISVKSGELLEVFEWFTDYSPEHMKENATMLSRIEETVREIMKSCRKMAKQLDLEVE